MDTDLAVIKSGLGPKTRDTLQGLGIENLGQLLEACANPSEELLKTPRITVKTLNKWKDVLRETLLPGTCPPAINHKAHENPYLSRYGEEWKEKIGEATLCRGFVSINKLIDHMFVETAKVFVGTAHENDWVLYHDALALFTSKESMEYMRHKGFLSHLILPQFGLNDGTAYANRMVGMRPEVMPLDAHLNQDLHESVDRHVNLTSHLQDDHAHKFSKRTPKHLGSAYQRIWDPELGPDAGAPSSKRICEDVHRIVNRTYLDIFARRGRVLDTAAYTGRRAVQQAEHFAAP